ncbi:MAG: MFS transporter, partial [Leptospirales bacterium]
MFSPLRNTAYRNLFIAQVITLVGTGFTTIGLALLAREIAGDDAGLVLGIALALKMLACVGIAPVAGAFAHFLPRRTTLTFLSIVRGALVCALPFVTEAFQIYLAIFFLNAFAAAYTPLFQATIPDILPDEKEYTRALSLSRLAYDLENL